MDGFADFTTSVVSTRQHTLAGPINCVGVGLHSGTRVNLSMAPAPADTGIVFRRTDLGIDLPARFDQVGDTRLCTVLTAGDARIGTVEHVMAALAGCGIDNAVVGVDGPEVPVFDGSAAPFTFLIDCAGRREQSAPRRVIEIIEKIRVTDGEAFAEFRPHQSTPANGSIAQAQLDMALSIDFTAQAIGRQALSLTLTEQSFRSQLERARTFTLRAEIEALRAQGLALGGTLDNAVVVDGAQVLNPAGLRMKDEFVRHKLLDAVGDLALAGMVIHGRFVAHRTGHALNNKLLRALFAAPAAFRTLSLSMPQSSWFAPLTGQAAAD